MHISFNKIIRLTRGDTADIHLTSLLDNAKDVVKGCTEADTFYLGIAEPNQLFEDAIIKKMVKFEDIVDNDLVFHLSTSDTEFLYPGKYYYTIKIGNTVNQNELTVTTLINEKLFWLE